MRKVALRAALSGPWLASGPCPSPQSARAGIPRRTSSGAGRDQVGRWARRTSCKGFLPELVSPSTRLFSGRAGVQSDVPKFFSESPTLLRFSSCQRRPPSARGRVVVVRQSAQIWSWLPCSLPPTRRAKSLRASRSCASLRIARRRRYARAALALHSRQLWPPGRRG